MTEPPPEPPPEPDLGAEARKLLNTVQEWARRTLPEPPSGHPGPECQWCPLCQFASVLRGEHPELAERLSEAGAALVSAFSALAESAAAHAPAPPARRRPRPGPADRVQRIRIDDADTDETRDAGSTDDRGGPA